MFQKISVNLPPDSPQSWFPGFVGTYIWWKGFHEVKMARKKMTVHKT